MKEKKVEKICYKETTVLNEKGKVIKTIGYDPGNTNISGYGEWTHSDNTTFTAINVPSYPEISIGSAMDFGKLYTPSSSEPYNYSDYIGDSLKIENEKQNRICRSEQMTIARMNTLKEVLDAIDKCKSFDGVYKVVRDLRKEYDKLSGEGGK